MNTFTKPPAEYGKNYRRILVAINFTQASDVAFEEALRIAKIYRAELLIAHAYTMPTTLCFMPPECYMEWFASNRGEMVKKVEALVERARTEGVHCHGLVEEGFPDDAVIKLARKLHADLIIVGARNHNRVARLLSRSVGTGIAARAKCAVLTTHLPPERSKGLAFSRVVTRHGCSL
jgi:nucleotide-binding universal stress UspA family protein